MTEQMPCAGEGSNGGRLQMLPADAEVEGASGTYRPMGDPRISYASPPYSGGLALKLAVEKLEGKDVPKLTTCHCRSSPTTRSSSARKAPGRK